MRTVFILVFCSVFSLHASSQDSEINVIGKVTDSRTGKGIRAAIRYNSIPTGSIYGRFSDSTFTFPIFGTAKYQITAEADGYYPRTVIVDPRKAGGEKEVVRNLGLSPKGETIRLNNLIFPQGKADIDPKSFQELDELAEMLKEKKKMVIQLEGHTDNTGSAKANMELSQSRVEAVKKYLVKQGVAKDRVKTKAFGGTQPLKNEQSPEARVMNRRVEMRILND